MRRPTSHHPIAWAVLRARDPVTELMIVATMVLFATSLLFLALARLLS